MNDLDENSMLDEEFDNMMSNNSTDKKETISAEHSPERQ
jgi:hypothetical protein